MVFSSTLIPQTSEAVFAGVKLNLTTPLNITGDDIISVKGRGSGNNDKVKFHMRDGTLDANDEGGYYKANFTVRENKMFAKDSVY